MGKRRQQTLADALLWALWCQACGWSQLFKQRTGGTPRGRARPPQLSPHLQATFPLLGEPAQAQVPCDQEHPGAGPGHVQRSDSPPPPCGHTASFAWPDQLAISCALENHSALWGGEMLLRLPALCFMCVSPGPTSGVFESPHV